jgi:hypothetical protein
LIDRARLSSSRCIARRFPLKDLDRPRFGMKSICRVQSAKSVSQTNLLQQPQPREAAETTLPSFYLSVSIYPPPKQRTVNRRSSSTSGLTPKVFQHLQRSNSKVEVTAASKTSLIAPQPTGFLKGIQFTISP